MSYILLFICLAIGIPVNVMYIIEYIHDHRKF